MSEKQKILISGLSALFVVIILFFLAIFPLSKKIKETSNKISETRYEILKIAKKKQMSRKIEDQFEKTQKDLPEIKNALFDPEKLVDLVVTLEDIAAETSTQLNIGESNTQQKFINFSVNLWGNFTNFYRFIKKIENLPYLDQIDTIAIKKLEPQEIAVRNQNGGPILGSGDIGAVMKFKIFTQ